MKTKLLHMSLLCLLFVSIEANANETEPNNTPAQANNLTLNGNNNGIVNPGGDQDWWKITTTQNGQLNITLQSLGGHYLSFQLYDNNGITKINAQVDYINNTATQSTDGLAAGTYYLKITATDPKDTGSYIVSNTLTLAGITGDTEPNGTRDLALTLPLYGSVTGYVGYFYNSYRDTSDWYKVTTGRDGKISLTLISLNKRYLSLSLFDNDGTTLLNHLDFDNDTVVLNTDGLAAGTYYIKIHCTYYNSDFAPYKLSNTLTQPSQANDVEPNNTKAQAVLLPLNGSRMGHVGYYYNNHRDTIDWYKIVTNADGQLNLTLSSNNGKYLSLNLFDNNGTILLNHLDFDNSTVTLATNGLAKGTYYIKVNCTYYNSDFAPYTLKDSLYPASVANDAEPNNLKTQAIVLVQNSSATGHVGYYYNNRRDTADWYRITTSDDGLLKITFTSENGEYLSLNLYDNNGTKILNSYSYNNNTVTLKSDGLRAGTYYIKLFCTHYNSAFAPYTLQDSLITYTYAKDIEPNNKPYQAKTMPANSTITGHVGFYYNNSRDTVDWYKINYTGNGALDLTLNLEGWKFDGLIRYFSISVYKDTNASFIYHKEFINTATTNINLSSLTQGYYWILVHATYYNNEFGSYSLENNFTQTTTANIAVVAPSIDTSTACNNTNSITFKCTQSSPPYTVQLYRYGLAYGNPLIIRNNNPFKFSNLPHGYYYATAFGDGATDTAFGKSPVRILVPKPVNPNTTNIKSAEAKLNWTSIACASYYVIQYRKQTDANWTIRKTIGNINTVTLRNLSPATTYKWRVASADTANAVGGVGAYTDTITFTTAASVFAGIAENTSDIKIQGSQKSTALVHVYPNPATTQIRIQYEAGNTNARILILLKNINGATILTDNTTEAAISHGTTMDLSKLSAGIYLLQLIAANESVIATQKIAVTR